MKNNSILSSNASILLLRVTDTAGVFLFWRVSAVAARAALTGGRTKIVYGRSDDSLKQDCVFEVFEATGPLLKRKSRQGVTPEMLLSVNYANLVAEIEVEA